MCFGIFFYCFHWEWFGSVLGVLLRKNSPLHDLISVCKFIDFEKKFPPARLFCPASLMFFKNFSTCTFISSCTSIRHTRVHPYFHLVLKSFFTSFFCNFYKKVTVSFCVWATLRLLLMPLRSDESLGTLSV